jgi:hypothetical protein
MHIARLVLLLWSLGGAVDVVYGSEEEVLVLSAFRVESPGTGAAGPVIVSGARGAEGFERLKVEAFGRDFDFTQDQLNSLRGVVVNGLQLSYETGYPALGGRTIYLQFFTGFTSGIKRRMFVVITESGSIRIGERP